MLAILASSRPSRLRAISRVSREGAKPRSPDERRTILARPLFISTLTDDACKGTIISIMARQIFEDQEEIKKKVCGNFENDRRS
jgi:hypothetical protein